MYFKIKNAWIKKLKRQMATRLLQQQPQQQHQQQSDYDHVYDDRH